MEDEKMKVRCIDVRGSGLLKLGRVYEVTELRQGTMCLTDEEGCEYIGYSSACFEPVSDTIPAPPPEPAKFDPYELHRLTDPYEAALADIMAARGRSSGATVRLHAALAAEKPVERVKQFPVAGRNPR